jgi:hypothetical protein
VIKHLWYRIKWRYNIGNIRQRYANYCGRVKRAKPYECVRMDADVCYICTFRIRKLLFGSSE